MDLDEDSGAFAAPLRRVRDDFGHRTMLCGHHWRATLLVRAGVVVVRQVRDRVRELTGLIGHWRMDILRIYVVRVRVTGVRQAIMKRSGGAVVCEGYQPLTRHDRRRIQTEVAWHDRVPRRCKLSRLTYALARTCFRGVCELTEQSTRRWLQKARHRQDGLRLGQQAV